MPSEYLTREHNALEASPRIVSNIQLLKSFWPMDLCSLPGGQKGTLCSLS